MDVRELVATQYPSLIGLLGDPEIGPLLAQAVDPNAGFSPETFQARLHETTWWRSRTQEQREMEMLSVTDPASYTARLGESYAGIYDWMNRMGVQMTPEEVTYIGTNFTNRGLDLNSEMAKNEMKVWLRANWGRAQPGGPLWTAAHMADQMARREWFAEPGPQQLFEWGTQLVNGEKNEAGLRQLMGMWSAAMYPHLYDRISQGETLADIANPYREVIAKELEFGTIEEVDMVNGPWNKWLLGIPTEQGTMRLPTAQEAREAARRDYRWWGTQAGREGDATMASTLLETFGRRAA